MEENAEQSSSPSSAGSPRDVAASGDAHQDGGPDQGVPRSASLFPPGTDDAPELAEQSRFAAPGAGFLWFVRLLLLGAVGVSVYLLWFTLSGKAVPGCSGDAGCGKVLSSKYAKWVDIPVSAPALLVYVTLLGATLGLGGGASHAGQRKAWTVAIAASLLVVLAGLWFVSVQLFILKEVCPFCMATHSFGLIAGFAVLLRAPIGKGGVGDDTTQTQTDTPRDPLAIAPGQLGGVVVLALFLTATLVVGQLTSEGGGAEVVRTGDPTNGGQGTGDGGNGKQNGTTQLNGKKLVQGKDRDSGPGAERVLWLMGGKVKLEPAKMPTMGDASKAKVVFLYLFDYTCPHCQEVHDFFYEAFDRFGDQIAVVSVPNPLSHKCNPSMTRTRPRHEEACEFAKLSMAVFKADPKKWEAFDKWLLSNELGLPLYPTAKAKAEETVGVDALNDALASDFPSDMVKRGGDLYQIAGRGSLPRVVWVGGYMAGAPDSAEDFCKVLKDEFKLEDRRAKAD